MKPSQNAINLIKQFEGFRKDSYICPAGIPTIGYGSTSWGNGQKVKIGEVITMDGAEKLLLKDIERMSKALTGLNINQNQFDALCSFIYNLGVGAFNRSTLRNKVASNPIDSSIRAEFMKWNKHRKNGKLVASKGLTRRRDAEANLYFNE